MSALSTWLSSAAAPFVAGFLLTTLALGHAAALDVSLDRAGASCAEKKSEAEQADCWMQIVLLELRKRGIGPAFRQFAKLYERYPVFGATGCHSHAHRVGDAAYYGLYVAEGLSLKEIDFPQETTTCGYGFFHGFIEHLIQDKPDEAFVVETCEYLRGRLAGTMRDIGTICYHASGHGFQQTEADDLHSELWGRADLLVQRPLARCESLPTNDAEIEDCRQGVFNVITDWMAFKNFGLALDLDDPLRLCRALPERWHHACFYELAQKLEPVTRDSPAKAAALVGGITRGALREMTFGVMIAGMLQRQAPLNGYPRIIAECIAIADDALFKTCVQSSANGLMEHGSPGREYEKVLDLCATPALSARGGDRFCYEALAHRLSRFYPAEKKHTICGKFPASFHDACRTAR